MLSAGMKVKEVISRKPPSPLLPGTKIPHKYIQHLNHPLGQIILLAVRDSAIEEVALLLQPLLKPSQILAHCSGAMPLGTLGNHPNIGVLYPLQTFTQEKVVPFDSPPISLFVEGSTREVQDTLMTFAQALSPVVHQMDSERRRRLHLGAIFCCNFVNHLFRITSDLAGDIPFDVYEPLIRNQLEQSLNLGPEAAQTGPAIRGDATTIHEHLNLLTNKPELQELYVLMSRLINPDLPHAAKDEYPPA